MIPSTSIKGLIAQFREVLALLLAFGLLASPGRAEVAVTGVAEGQDFVFYSVLEGLYADGLSTEDVNQILLRPEGGEYSNFVYACPVCEAVVWALGAYRDRPRFHGLKSGASTFGPGLSGEVKAELSSKDSDRRLLAVNALVDRWVNRRKEMMRLSAAERTKLDATLEGLRKQGMDTLEGFREKGGASTIGVYAPAYQNLKECAVCNGAVGKPMRFSEKTP